MALDGVNAVAAAAILSNSNVDPGPATAGVVVAAITPGILGLAYPFVLAQNAPASPSPKAQLPAGGSSIVNPFSAPTTSTAILPAAPMTTTGSAAAPPPASPPAPTGSAGSNGAHTPPVAGAAPSAPQVTYTEIPDIVSKSPTLHHASKLLGESRLTANPLYSYSIDVVKDHVISQNPAAGTTAPLDSSVDVIVSAGPVPLPSPAAETQLAARVERIAEHEETLKELVRALASHEQRLVEIAQNHQVVLSQLESMQNSFERRLEKLEGNFEGRVARAPAK